MTATWSQQVTVYSKKKGRVFLSMNIVSQTCPKCKCELTENYNFCPNCGKKLTKAERKYRKRENGTGNISKLSGNRTKPWMERKGDMLLGEPSAPVRKRRKPWSVSQTNPSMTATT